MEWNLLVCYYIGQKVLNHFRIECVITFCQESKMAVHVDWCCWKLMYGSTLLIILLFNWQHVMYQNLVSWKKEKNYFCIYQTFKLYTHYGAVTVSAGLSNGSMYIQFEFVKNLNTYALVFFTFFQRFECQLVGKWVIYARNTLEMCQIWCLRSQV